MTQSTQTQQLSHVKTHKANQILASAILALVVLSIVGFAPLEVIHNAAHDTRHSSGFPCH